MQCEEPDGCEKEAIGKDIQGWNLCREHLAFSIMVQKMCNAGLDAAGHPDLVPMNVRFPQEIDGNN